MRKDYRNSEWERRNARAAFFNSIKLTVEDEAKIPSLLFTVKVSPAADSAQVFEMIKERFPEYNVKIIQTTKSVETETELDNLYFHHALDDEIAKGQVQAEKRAEKERALRPQYRP